MKLLERVFGPRLGPDDHPDHDPDLDEVQRASDETLDRVHEAIGYQNDAIAAQRRVAQALGATADAIDR